MSLLLILLEPTLLLGRLLTSNSLTLNFDGLGLVGLQIAGKAGLFGRWRGFGSGEFLDVCFSLTCFNGLGLVGAEFAEVEVLDGVGCCSDVRSSVCLNEGIACHSLGGLASECLRLAPQS
jgi:hypothetical protein